MRSSRSLTSSRVRSETLDEPRLLDAHVGLDGVVDVFEFGGHSRVGRPGSLCSTVVETDSTCDL